MGIAGTTILAGCTGDDALPTEAGDDADDDTDTGTTDDQEAEIEDSGRFRLLISDQPTAIDDFDALNVSFASARVFRGDGDDLEQDDDVLEGNETTENTSQTENESINDENVTDTDADDVASDDEDPEEAGNGAGYVEFDLDGATVDLTTVIGEKAISVLEDDLEEGRYSTIELRAEDVEGIVDGDEVDVHIPSGRLRIVRPFDVVAGEELSFVFDINVVQRGQTGRYNLLPVIGQSGVVGEDVEAEEIDPDEEDVDEDDGSDGPPDDAGSDDAGSPANESNTTAGN